MKMKVIFPVMNITEAVVKIKALKKIQTSTGFKPMISAIALQCSTT